MYSVERSSYCVDLTVVFSKDFYNTSLNCCHQIKYWIHKCIYCGQWLVSNLKEWPCPSQWPFIRSDILCLFLVVFMMHQHRREHLVPKTHLKLWIIQRFTVISDTMFCWFKLKVMYVIPVLNMPCASCCKKTTIFCLLDIIKMFATLTISVFQLVYLQ